MLKQEICKMIVENARLYMRFPKKFYPFENFSNPLLFLQILMILLLQL
jgi:hypothetical protein